MDTGIRYDILRMTELLFDINEIKLEELPKSEYKIISESIRKAKIELENVMNLRNKKGRRI